MITLTQENFALKVQELFEKSYLQPLDGLPKKDIQDGFIERRIHGAMHASRTVLWALRMHQLLLRLTPEYVNSALETLAKYTNIDKNTLLLMILMTMACHDAARKGEGYDIWELDSAKFSADFLGDLGLDEKHVVMFSDAIYLKDKPGKYFETLKTLGIEEKDYNHFDYIRKLINLGDNLDILRCVSRFETKQIFRTLATITGFDNSVHYDEIINLVLDAHQFIYDQHDMLFDCSIVDLNNREIVTLPANFNLARKTLREHSGNVFASILSDMLQYLKFQILQDYFSIPLHTQFQGTAAYDPYIHGTNTAVFATLPKTDFYMMSPIDMIDKYHTAPIMGELTQGGYARVHDASIGKTSFGQLSSKDENSYTLEKIITNYTQIAASTSEKGAVKKFLDAVHCGYYREFSNINLIIIYLARARQNTTSLDEIISPVQLDKLRQDLEATVQYYNFLQLIGTYIYPDYNAIKHSGMKQDIVDSFYSILTSEYIKNKIKYTGINMRTVLENPTQEHLISALAVLELPRQCTIKSDPGTALPYVNKNINLTTTQYFSLTQSEHDRCVLYPEYSFLRLSQNIDDWNINSFLKKFAKKDLNGDFFMQLGKLAEQHLIAFLDRVRILEQLIEARQHQFELPHIPESFLKNPFPLIFIVEENEHIYLSSIVHYEYRSKSKLKLGTDIKMIATDTKAHQLELMKYLEHYNLSSLQVVLFDDLKKCKIDNIKPKVHYAHADGFPTLKWQAAKMVPPNDLLFFKAQESIVPETGIPDDGIYSIRNLDEVKSLMEDAEIYGQIQFGI